VTSELVLPEPDMSLFELTNPDDWRANVRMDHELDWGLYAVGYQEATHRLLNHAASGRDQDTLIYPIMFSARQAIELQLKEAIRLADGILGREGPYPDKHPMWEHKLRPLWEKARKRNARVEELFHPGAFNAQHTRSFGKLVDELDQADPLSYAFRYPIDKTERPSFTNDDGTTQGGNRKVPRLINARDLKRPLSAMFNYLNGVTAWLGFLSETKDTSGSSIGTAAPPHYRFGK